MGMRQKLQGKSNNISWIEGLASKLLIATGWFTAGVPERDWK